MTGSSRVFWATLALFLVTTRGVDTADAAVHLAEALAWVERGTGDLDLDPGGRWVPTRRQAGGLLFVGDDGRSRSAHPPGLALLATPLAAVLSWRAGPSGDGALGSALQAYFAEPPAPSPPALFAPVHRDPRGLAFLLLFPVGGALAAAWTWLSARRLGLSRPSAAVGVGLLVASPLSVYAGTAWPQVLAAACWAGAACAAVRRPRPSAVGLGGAVALALLLRPEHALLVPLLALGLWAHRRGGPAPFDRPPTVPIAATLASAVTVLALLAVLRPTAPGPGFVPGAILAGARDLLVHPDGGLLWHAPFALVVLAGLTSIGAPLVRCLVLAVVPLLAVYGAWFDPRADLAYGPRFLVPVLPWMALGAAALWEGRRRARPILAGAGWVGAAVALPALVAWGGRLPPTDLAAAYQVAWAHLDDPAWVRAPAVGWCALAASLVALAGLLEGGVTRVRRPSPATRSAPARGASAGGSPP